MLSWLQQLIVMIIVGAIAFIAIVRFIRFLEDTIAEREE